MQKKRKAARQKQAAATPFWSTPSFVRVALAVLALGVYVNTIPGRFVFDDTAIVHGNPSIQGLDAGHLREIFGGHYWRNVESRGGLYRPVTVLSYAINYALGGENPAGYHVANIALHAINTALVWALLQSLFARPLLSFLAALFFALHPIRTEAVASIVGRAELLSAFFMLAAWVTYAKARQTNRRLLYAISAAAFGLAAMTKESAFCFPALLILTDLFVGPEGLRNKFEVRWTAARYAPFAAVGVLVLGLRYAVLGGLAPLYINPSSNPLASAAPWPRFLTATWVFAKYLLLLLFPAELSADYSYNQIPVVQSIVSWRGAVSMALLAAIAAATFVAFRARPFLFFSSFVFFASFALTSNWLRPIGTIMAERLMYFPALGFNCCVAWMLAQGFEREKWRRATLAAAAVLAAGYGIRAVERNLDWRDHYALFGSAVRTSPDSSLVQSNYAAVLLYEKKDARGAAEHARVALRIMPEDPSAWFTLGMASRALGDLAGAADAFGRVVSLAPRTSGGTSALKQAAEIHVALGDLALARREYELLLQWRPTDPSALAALETVNARMGAR